jgi:3-oxoacyl-[acyl-carrier protein] reductase
MLLEDRFAVVTGGSQGIGAAISLAFARAGAGVCLCYRESESEARRLEVEIGAMGRKVMTVQGDLSSFTDARRVVETAREAFGRIDILVNNAGIGRDGVSWKMTEEQWDSVIQVNLKSCFNMTRHVAPILKSQRSGKIINITSINGMRGKFGQSNYCASKAGMIGYTKAIAKELGPFGVNVNALAPGLIDTRMLKASPARDKVIDLAMGEIALKRLGTPEDVADVAVFLASEMSRHVTGEVLKVDGGQYI